MSLASLISMHRKQLLLIDDDPMMHRLTAAFLKPLDIDLIHAIDGRCGLELLRRQPIDLVLLDYEMPCQTGLEVLLAIREDRALNSIPVIFATGSADDKVITACYEAGATDYVRKPYCRAEIIARVRASLDRQQMLLELRTASSLDRLTGLPNRALLLDRLSFAIERRKRLTDYQFALLFLDFDHFKIVNDSLGHQIGDALLKEISSRLRTNLRPHDSICREDQGTLLSRLGGDEFVVLLDAVAGPEAAIGVAERLLGTLNQPYQVGDHTICSTASIGIVASCESYESAEEMLRDADTAMYQAKARGKGCAVSFDPAMRAAVQKRLSTENDLRAAIGSDQFFLQYQPIVSLETRQMQGVEALVRWNHPQRGTVPPMEFIGIAEETRLILPLSDWILARACEQFINWQHDAPDRCPQYISVNLSRVQLTQSSLAERTLATLELFGIPTSCLQLEVTESEVMQNRDMAVCLLNQFKSAGVRLAMDDFGTGHSSLSCLHEFPFDVIKIDRAFVKSLGEGRRDFVAMIQSVLSLAHNLGMQCVAEGIEHPDHVAVLQSIDCAFGQGYYFGKPMLPEQLIGMQWDELPRKIA